MTTARNYLTSSAVGDKIYCIGGISITSSSNYLSTNECYDTVTNAWTTKKAMTTARHYLTSSVVGDKIYLIGGENDVRLSTNECYIP